MSKNLDEVVQYIIEATCNVEEASSKQHIQFTTKSCILGPTLSNRQKKKGVKLECEALTRSKALLIYHHFKSCVQEIKYDPHLVAAACLALSIKHNEEEVEFDAIIIVFFCMIHQEHPSIEEEKFKKLSQSVTSVIHVILRMIEFNLTHILAHQFLPYFMIQFHEEVLHLNRWEAFLETCMKIANDFYYTNKCINYTGEEIAAGAVQVSLFLIGINITDDDCYLKDKIEGLCKYDETKRQNIFEDIFKICAIGPESKI